MLIFRILALAICTFLAFVNTAFAGCNPRAFNGVEDNVARAYIAYYGRPADSGGLAYWANRMVSEGGSLNTIMDAFGVSSEFTDRYGSLSNADLVKGTYRQLFGRDPEAEGLNYYVGELNSGRRTLQTIALDVLFGARNEDAAIIANRLTASKHFTTRSEAPGFDPAGFDDDAMAAVLAVVFSDSWSQEAACGYYDAMLDALGGVYARTLNVTKTADGNDGGCNSDCSLRDAVAVANTVRGRTRINLPAGNYLLNLGHIAVTGDVHIHGAGAESTLVDGNQTSRLFVLDSSTARLVLSRVTVRNGNADFGGALLNKGTAILDRVVLTGNRAYNGGAVINTGSVTGFGLVASNNQAVSVNDSTGFGGMLWNDVGGNYGIFAGTISQNIALYNGAGIYAAGSGIIANTQFSGNQAGGPGGAVDVMGQLTLVGNVFSRNSANDGGAIASRSSDARVTASTLHFEENTAAGQNLGGGGAVFNYGGAISFRDCVFSRNSAYGEGGGAIESNGTLDLTNTLFDGNYAPVHDGGLPGDTAPGFGGALLIIAGSATRIENSQFTNNTAGNSGGAIYNDRNSRLVINSSLFQANRAQGLFARGGGYGGAIASEGYVTLAGSAFSSNASKEGGGALSTNVGGASVTNCSLTNNGSGNGGGLVAYSGTLALTDSVVRGNTAAQWGGAMLNDTAQSTVTRVEMTGNHAYYGGGFSNNNAVGQVSLDGSTINNNTATDGSAFVNFGTVNIKNSAVCGTRNNHATVNNLGGSTSICSF